MQAEKEFKELVKQIKRNGINNLMKWLETTDFYQAPASTIYHGNYPGGLVEHSCSVYEVAHEFNEMFGTNIENESVLICALFHDICKVNYYKIDEDAPSQAQMTYLQDLLDKNGLDMPDEITKTYASLLIDHFKNRPNEPIPEYKIGYKLDDQFPLGHGEKSLFLLSQYMALKPEEALAIRWHLGGFDPGIYFNYPSGYPFNKTMNNCKLAQLILIADLSADYLLGK